MAAPKEGSRDTGQGIIVCLTPDVCKTPVGSSLPPVPYSITAKQGDDANTVSTVRMTKNRAHNMASLVTKCTGDQPGSGTGVKSGTVGSVCHPKTHSGTVNIEGKPAIRHTDEWYMNNKNTIGKLTYVVSSETFQPTPAVGLAQDPDLEAPEDVSPTVAAMLRGMERAREEGLPEGSYEVAQMFDIEGLPDSMPNPAAPPPFPMSNPSTVFRAPTGQAANTNRVPTPQPTPQQSTNRVERSPAVMVPSPMTGAPAPMPGGAVGLQIARSWNEANEIMTSGHPLNVSPDVYARAEDAEAALREWANDYSAANGGAAVPDYVWGDTQDSLSIVGNDGFNQVLDARRSSSEGRRILRDYAAANDIQPDQLTEEDMRQILSSEDPMAVPLSSLASQPAQVVATRTDEDVSVRDDEDTDVEECLVGEYKEILASCDGETHHIVPDMVYRVGVRPTGAAMNSSAGRIPNSPTFNEGMSICLTPAQHGSGPTGIHGRLRPKLRALPSPVAGTAPMGLILATSLGEISAIDGLSAECKALAIARATAQVVSSTGLGPPGRTLEAPTPLRSSGEALRVLRAGSYS